MPTLWSEHRLVYSKDNGRASNDCTAASYRAKCDVNFSAVP